MDNYVYPDVQDALTISFIDKFSPYPDYWEKSEQFVLKTAKKLVQKHIKKQGSSFLDAGCGSGRLILEFQQYFDKILAIEPDIQRFTEMEKLLEDRNLSNKVLFESKTIEQIDASLKFDVILCSHVFQHVHTSNLPNILVKLKNHLKPQGLMIILTCHSKKNYDFFTKEYLKNKELIETTISEEEFNSIVQNDQNILPHCYFSMKKLIQTCSDLKLKTIESKSFHILDSLFGLDKFIFRDRLFNSSAVLKTRFGKDMMLVLHNESSN